MKYTREVIHIGRILVVEFTGQETSAFDEIIEVLKRYPDFNQLCLGDETKLLLPGVDIYLDRRKVYCSSKDVNLTAKEYDLLCLLAANKGRVLTYEQIYRQVWGEEYVGNVNNAVGCHIRNLRGKLYAAAPDSPLIIKCVREVGYCLEFKI